MRSPRTVVDEALARASATYVSSDCREGLGLRDDLKITSLRMVGVLTQIARDLGVSLRAFSGRDLRRLKTVGDLITKVEEVAAKEASHVDRTE